MRKSEKLLGWAIECEAKANRACDRGQVSLGLSFVRQSEKLLARAAAQVQKEVRA